MSTQQQPAVRRTFCTQHPGEVVVNPTIIIVTAGGKKYEKFICPVCHAEHRICRVKAETK